ncbi:MAG TPA: hypothetical protein VIX87_09250 [Steroidobacteraceae bacterium]
MLHARNSKRPLGLALIVLALCAGLAACAVHWPWRHRPAPAPQPVEELSIQPAPGPAGAPAPIQQFWDRNTLLLDLTALRGEGAATLRAAAARGWPIRLEFRVQPGNFARLEVQGSERVVFEIPDQGHTVVLKLSPDACVPDTPQITLRWSAAGDSAH